MNAYMYTCMQAVGENIREGSLWIINIEWLYYYTWFRSHISFPKLVV